MNRINTEAMVLRRINFGEADRIVTLLTDTHGKISAIAKGVRKPKSKLAGGIEIFSLSSISLIKGKTDLYTITSSRMEEHYTGIVSDLDVTENAFFLLRLYDALTDENSDNPEYLSSLKNAFKMLDGKPAKSNSILCWAILQAMKQNGSTPNVTHDGYGKSLLPDKTYFFSVEDGCFYESESGLFDSNDIKAWRVFLQAEPQQLINISGLEEPAKKAADALKQFAEFQA